MKPEDITAVVLTRNEERNLPQLFRSLPVGIHTLIVDCESSDRTQAIASSFGARVVERPWIGFVEARQFALTQIHTPWVLALDADEVVDEQLCAAINKEAALADGYIVKRDTFFCGKPMRLWRNEKLLRLFRTNVVRVEARPAVGGTAQLHERYVTDGSLKELEGRLLHFSYPDVVSYREKYERYTAIEARGFAAGTAANSNNRMMRIVRSVATGWIRFMWLLIGKGAILDGWRGAYVAYYSAMYPAAVMRKIAA